MQREYISNAPCQYNPVRIEGPSQVSGSRQDLSPNENVPSATLIGPYASMNHPSFGYSSQSTSNTRYYDSSSQVSGSGEQPQYEYQGDHWQNVAYYNPPSGTSQPIFNLPTYSSPHWPRYSAPPAHDSEWLNDGHAPQRPNVTLPSQGFPSTVPSAMSMGEELGQLVNQYLHNSSSRRSGKVKVMIILELDDVE
ncbi:hypothetical protein BGW80DRAFT_1445436 [Lactifluus volemus]|nr:hypothetical protein BGW80DRAFT_1445436 [Lactifluus volemus]